MLAPNLNLHQPSITGDNANTELRAAKVVSRYDDL